MIDEILESPGFWMLGGLGVGAELLGYFFARNQGWEVLPLWQMGLLLLGTLAAAAFYALKE